ncbi:hypothetical protein B0H13DRAFT_2678171 [Mycena leptocephala]|nr:hypothetical protein B0H13DRAFT_2678171 [Mycena leptocephala]
MPVSRPYCTSVTTLGLRVSRSPLAPMVPSLAPDPSNRSNAARHCLTLSGLIALVRVSLLDTRIELQLIVHCPLKLFGTLQQCSCFFDGSLQLLFYERSPKQLCYPLKLVECSPSSSASSSIARSSSSSAHYQQLCIFCPPQLLVGPRQLFERTLQQRSCIFRIPLQLLGIIVLCPPELLVDSAFELELGCSFQQRGIFICAALELCLERTLQQRRNFVDPLQLVFEPHQQLCSVVVCPPELLVSGALLELGCSFQQRVLLHPPQPTPARLRATPAAPQRRRLPTRARAQLLVPAARHIFICTALQLCVQRTLQQRRNFVECLTLAARLHPLQLTPARFEPRQQRGNIFVDCPFQQRRPGPVVIPLAPAALRRATP